MKAGRALAVARAALAKALEAALVVVVVATLVFLALRLLPGDPARLVLGDEASADEIASMRHRLGVDAPLHVQYARFLAGLVRLDFGESLRHPGEPAWARVASSIGPTAALALIAVALGAVAGIGVAVLARGPWLGLRARRVLAAAPTAVAATPLLSFAPLATYVLAARLRVVPLPADPEAGAGGLLFAASLLALPLAAAVARVSGAALEGVIRAPFVAVARAKGGSHARAFLLHALPACSGPIVTVIASQLGALLGGAVVLERLFERPGLGSLILEAYAARDLPVLEGAVVAAAALFVGVQIVAAGLHAAVDPRVRA
jgi:peptide/nickel transport system permease protein